MRCGCRGCALGVTGTNSPVAADGADAGEVAGDVDDDVATDMEYTSNPSAETGTMLIAERGSACAARC